MDYLDAYPTQLFPGDTLSPSFPGMPRQVVRSVRNDPDNERVFLTTDQGEWHIDPMRVTLFPMHRDGRVIDWRFEDRIPSAYHLGVGDILPNADVPQPPEWERYSRYEKSEFEREMRAGEVPGRVVSWYADYQTVKTMKPHVQPDTVVMYTSSAMGQPRRWRVIKQALLTWPRRENPEPPKKDVSLPPPDATRAGPYAPTWRPDLELMIYVHPTGHGRWPPDYPKFQRVFVDDLESGKRYDVRPPAAGDVTLWYGLTLLDGGTPHPRDPRYRAK